MVIAFSERNPGIDADYDAKMEKVSGFFRLAGPILMGIAVVLATVKIIATH